MYLKELVSIGERSGLTGDALTKCVHEGQALAKEACAAEREAERK